MKSTALILLFLIAPGCSIHHLAAPSTIVEYAKARQAEKAVQNLLWYEGSDDTYDYFKYVYNMAEERCFAVPTGQVDLVQRFPKTDDHTQWRAIAAIADFPFWTPDTP